MSNVEPIATTLEPAANGEHPVAGWEACVGVRDRAERARRFLMNLAAREVQICDPVAGWLRAAGEGLAALDEPRAAAMADDCVRLAAQTWALREDLSVIVHRLVARWNRLEQLAQRTGSPNGQSNDRGNSRIDVIALLTRPPSAALTELFELHERIIAGPTPWLELAALRPIEQMLAHMIPLAIDVAGVDDSDLAEAAQLYAARERRSGDLGSLLANLIAADPQRSPAIVDAEERSLAAFTKVLDECATLGRGFDGWRHGFVR